MDSEEQTSFNWTVDSGTHSIEIFTLLPSRLYWVTVAAVNGAGVGVQSDPYKLLIGTLKKTNNHFKVYSAQYNPCLFFFPLRVETGGDSISDRHTQYVSFP